MNIDAMDEYVKFIDLMSFPDVEDEVLTGESCPKCGYPLVLESGLEVCYCCGWYKGSEQEGNCDE